MEDTMDITSDLTIEPFEDGYAVFDRNREHPLIAYGFANIDEAKQLLALANATFWDAVTAAWNSDDPDVIKLRDGRQVSRRFYDRVLHGPPVV